MAGKIFRKNQVRTGFEPLVRGSTWFRFEFGSEAEPEPEFGFEVRQKCLRTGPNRTAAALHRSDSTTAREGMHANEYAFIELLG